MELNKPPLFDEEKTLRKLRKKLRQIEKLENLQRLANLQLNEEEVAKVSQKFEIRKIIEEMKRKSNEICEKDSPAKLQKRNRCSRASESSRNSQEVSDLNQEEQLEISNIDSTSRNENVLQDDEPSSSSASVSVTLTNPDEREDAESKVASNSRLTKGSHKVDKLKWRQNNLLVHELEGHEDLVCCVDLDLKHDVAMTGSRDTSVLVWKISEQRQLFSLRGHTLQITAVKVIGNLENENVMGLSASLDCSLKVWNVKTGLLLRSIYTYNGIKCLDFCCDLKCAITGTDGGKLEFFDIFDSKTLQSFKAHDDVITTLDVNVKEEENRYLASGSRDGMIKVWNFKKDSIKCVFVSENVKTAFEDQALHIRCILSLKIVPDNPNILVYGDSGSNIKMLDWTSGIVQKFPNHTSEMGFTDCISIHRNLIMASSYDLDTGLGHVNLFCLKAGNNPSYICSFSDDETSRIFSLKFCSADNCGKTQQDLTFFTVGREVKVWKSFRSETSDNQLENVILVKPLVLALYVNNVVDSGSDTDEAESENLGGSPVQNEEEEAGGQKSSWKCYIL